MNFVPSAALAIVIIVETVGAIHSSKAWRAAVILFSVSLPFSALNLGCPPFCFLIWILHAGEETEAQRGGITELTQPLCGLLRT